MSDPRGQGEFPTTGGARPGPVGFPRAGGSARVRIRPVAIRIPKIQVDTTVERRPVVDGVMADPTGPWVVAWYAALGWLNASGNVVMAGHVDFSGVGPSVFARVGELIQGDRIEVTGEDVQLYRYDVAWAKLVDADHEPIDEIIGQPDDDQQLTLVTCGGQFDPSAQRYLQRLIVRARRSP